MNCRYRFSQKQQKNSLRGSMVTSAGAAFQVHRGGGRHV